MTVSLISLPPLVTADGRFVPDVLLTVRQAAALCGCHMITVRPWVEAGLLPGAQVAEGGAAPDPPRADTLQHLVEENRRLAGTVTSLQRNNLFLRSLLIATPGAAA